MQLLFVMLRNPLFWLMMFLLWGIIHYYNKMVNARTRAEESLANIERLLKQRLNFIPQLVRWNLPANEHADHALRQLVHYQEFAPKKSLIEADLNQRALDYYHVTQQMSSYFHSIPDPIDTEAKKTYQDAYQQYSDIEKDLNEAIQSYNQKTGDYNVLIESFPSGIVAAILGVGKRQMFV